MRRNVNVAVSVVLLLPFWFSLAHSSESVTMETGRWFPWSANWLVGVVLPCLALSLICISLLSPAVRTRATRILNGGPYLSVLTLTLVAWAIVTAEVGLRSVSTRTPSPLHVGLNYLGYRGPVVSLAKPDNLIYVAAIGGSTTYGNKVDWWEAWPAYLETFLNAKNETQYLPRVRVVNLGLEAAGLDCGIRRFRHFSRLYEFDALVVHAGYNAVGDWCQYWLPIGTQLRDVSLLILLVMEFLEEQDFYRMSVERLHMVLENEDNDNLESQSDDSFQNMYLDFVDVLLREDMMVMAVRQPRSASELAGSEMRYPDTAKELEKRLTARGDRLGLELLERFSDEQGFVLVDLHDVNLGGLRSDSIHLLPEGNKKIAQIIAREFLEGYAP